MSVTNLIADSSLFVGSAAGSPGTLPTQPPTLGWQIFNTGSLTQTLGFGRDSGSGYPYCDVRWNGTSNTTNLQILFGGIVVPASALAYVLSAYVALTAGNLTNVTAIGMNWDNYTGDLNSSAFTSSGAYTAFTPTGTLARQSTTATSNATANVIYPSVFININSGVAIDFTLRIAGIQFEQGTVPTFWSPTPPLLPFISRAQSIPILAQ